MAGLTGAVIVLPQGIAFATIAGLPYEYGLYTAMVTPIVAALFGSSWHLISGPTTAISIVIFSVVSNHATAGTADFVSIAITITFLTGIYQLVFGLARLGVLVNFVSHTVVIGFTAGAAILIATSQVKNVLGIHVPNGETFVHTWMDIWSQIGSTNLYILFISLSTIIIAVLIKKYYPKVPNLLIVLIIGSVISLMIGGQEHGVELIGAIPGNLPPLSTPEFSFALLKKLAPEAFAVALLGLIEAVSISRAIATKSNQRLNSNQEFIGQGLSNIVGSFFSCYAGSGSFTRSGVNYTAGAVTPLAAIFASILLLLILLLVSPLTAYLPVAAMAGVILLVAYNLIDLGQIKHIFKSSKSESAILITTFVSTLIFNLEFAIYLGVLLSIMIFLARTSTPEMVTLRPDYDEENEKQSLRDIRIKPGLECPQIKIVRIDMSIYFGSLNHIQGKINKIIERRGIYHILVLGSAINFIDLSGQEMLLSEARRLKIRGGGLYFVDLKPSVFKSMKKSNFIADIGEDNFFELKGTAISSIFMRINQNKCLSCEARVFSECSQFPEPIKEPN